MSPKLIYRKILKTYVKFALLSLLIGFIFMMWTIPFVNWMNLLEFTPMELFFQLQPLVVFALTFALIPTILKVA